MRSRTSTTAAVAPGMTLGEIHAHCAFVHRMARTLTRGRADHEDLAQDAIERWLRARPPLPGQTNHRAWLTTVLRNLVIDRFRRGARRLELSVDCTQLEEPGATAPRWQELQVADVERELARLPRALRTTFQRFAFEGKSYEEIARLEGINKSTVGTRILRARQQLRQLLEGN